jgi:prepilin-type N-terminal cleavage/methylation domain-containing protein
MFTMNLAKSMSRFRVGVAANDGTMHVGQSPQAGFTLLELIIVIFMLSSLALMSVFFVDSADDQARFEATRTRLAQLRYAMVGDANRMLNGETELYGFVADMGRLPENLQELIEPPDDSLLWQAREIDGMVTESIWSGWRGPYLPAMPEASMSTFRDGWGTSGDAPNFGWQFSVSDDVLSVKSLGKDAKVGGVDYEQDYPERGNLLEKEDWLIGINGRSIQIGFNKPAVIATDWALMLTLYFYNGAANSDQPLEEVESESLEVVDAKAWAKFADDEPPVPMGKYAAVIWCVKPGAPQANGAIVKKPFNGDCTAEPSTHSPAWLNLLPRRDHNLNIHWNIN